MSEKNEESLKRQQEIERQIQIERQKISDHQKEINREKVKVVNLLIEGKKVDKDFEGRVSTGDDDE